MSEAPIQGTSEQVLAFIKAFVEMQAAMGSVPKEAEGQIGTSRKFKYADFESIVTYCRPYFKSHGFAHFELCGAANGEATVSAVLVHNGGGLIQSHFSWPAKGHQEIGQGQTYFRRYGLSGLAGLSSGDDTDADGLQAPQQALRSAQSPPKQQAKPPVKAPPIEAQATLDEILKLVDGFNSTKEDRDDMMRAIANHAVEAHGMKPSELAKAGLVYKLDEVLRWTRSIMGEDNLAREAEMESRHSDAGDRE